MMGLRAHIQQAIRQLFYSKLRAFLAVLGILVGTASVVAMVSIGELATQQILAQFEQMGINLLSVTVFSENFSDTANSGPNANLSIDTANNLMTAHPNITLVAPYTSNYGTIVYKGTTLEGASVGLSPNMINIAQLSLASGRYLSFLDANDYFCVIGHGLYQSIKNLGVLNPIGTQIAVGDTIFTIVGILNPWPANYFFNTDFNTAVLIPLSTAISIKKNGYISDIALRIQNTSLLSETEAAIKRYISAHTIGQNVSVRSPKELIDSMKKSSETMTLLLGIIGSISLLVGGIGVMNIMLVSVAERHKEIGIRLAIGARQRDIQLQFLIESITLSVFGGLSGMILGVVVTYVVSLYSHWKFTFFFFPPLIGCGVSILVGIFFGFYPAWKASKLDPIQTLRSE
ncbi:MAG: FtsX-like permease family protein [Gammaproteobacteria bacterium]|nr:FtsX-like permease family protein [Gammaproteobacteria bacterium]